MIDHLERVSLVEFNNQAGIDRLSKAIESANKLHMVDTEGVEPMESVLEDRMLYLREDKVTDGNYRQDVLSNAVKTIEDYFVAPSVTLSSLKHKVTLCLMGVVTESHLLSLPKYYTKHQSHIDLLYLLHDDAPQ